MKTASKRASFDSFASAVPARIEIGRKVCCDRSMALEPAAPAAEIEEELLDVAAWSFILWCGLVSIRSAMERFGATRPTKQGGSRDARPATRPTERGRHARPRKSRR